MLVSSIAMETPIIPFLQQVHLGLGPKGYEPVTSAVAADSTTYAKEYEELIASLLRRCPEHVWPNDSYKSTCPRPILINRHHKNHLEDLHEALTAAITDIVQRWWSDKEASFPSRMPLAKEEEELLQWLDGQVLQGNLSPFSECRGSWRPDFLIQDNSVASSDEGSLDREASEVFCISEINARFSFNGLLFEAYGQEALDEMGLKDHGLASATKSDKVMDGLMTLFQPRLPLHLLKGEEYGYDIHLFMDVMRRRYGVTPRPITPADLRLVPDPESKSGFKLCCVVTDKVATNSHGSSAVLETSSAHETETASCPTISPSRSPAATTTTWMTSAGELVEEIHQVGLELHQREIAALEPEMLRQISLRCFNDMRTVLLVHDKRMLGIVKQELGPLVSRGVLTSAQAQILHHGIADTMIPGSHEMKEVLQATTANAELRNRFLLKPVRSGKGAGIVFGDEVSQEEWITALAALQSPMLVPGVSCVVQRRIYPRLYNVILEPSGDRARYPLVGTFHAVHGKLIGLGIWRTGPDRICALSTGGSWLCSVISQE